jgi:hypothetical protein
MSISRTPEERGINFIKSMCTKVILTDQSEIMHKEFDFTKTKAYIYTLKSKLQLRLKEPETEIYIEKIFKNPETGLGSIPSLYSQLKKQNLTFSKEKPDGITYNNIQEWITKQEPYQIMKSRNNTYQSYIADGPLEQFQIDLIYMPKSWFNNNFKYIF